MGDKWRASGALQATGVANGWWCTATNQLGFCASRLELLLLSLLPLVLVLVLVPLRLLLPLLLLLHLPLLPLMPLMQSPRPLLQGFWSRSLGVLKQRPAVREP